MAHLNRAAAREQLRAALAGRIAQADGTGWRDAVRDLNTWVH